MIISSDLGVILIILGAIGLAGFYIAAVWSLGCLLRVVNRSQSLSHPIVAFVISHAILGIGIQAIVCIGILQWYVLVPLLTCIILANLKINGIPKLAWAKLDISPTNWITWILVFGLIVLVGMIGVVTLSAPQTDALAYYMAQPKLMAATGAYTLLPGYEYFGTLSAIAEMPYAIMYALAASPIGFIAAKFLMWPVFIVVLCLLWLLAKQFNVSNNTAWIFVTLGATSTAVTLVAWDGKTDLVGVMYGLTAALCIPGLASERVDKTSPWLFGFISASAIMAKMSHLLVLPFCLGLPLILQWRKQPAILLNLIIRSCLAAFFSFAVGWWLKNLVIFGDPFAPFLNLRETTPHFFLEQVWFDLEKTSWILQTYPLALTFGLYPMQHGGLSPLWLMILPALEMRNWRSDQGYKTLYLALGSLAGLTLWMLLRPSVIAPRYFLPALLLPCLILVVNLDQWWSRKRIWAMATTTASILLVVLHLHALQFIYQVMTQPLIANLKGIEGSWPLLERARRLGADTREQVRVLMLSYYTELLPNEILRSFIVLKNPIVPSKSFAVKELNESETILEFVLREQVDYIVYDPITHKRNDLDLPPPPGLSVEKIEYVKDTYYLYIFIRENHI